VSSGGEILPPFDYHPLTRVIFGNGTLSRLGEATREVGATRVLLVTDPGLAAAGHPQRAQANLLAAGLEVILFDGVGQNPTTEHVEKGRAFAQTKNIDCIVAVGGGSAMDCAKGINFLLTNGGTMSDYQGHGKARRPMLPSVAVPTTAGTGSEGQSYALISDAVTHVKMACGDRKAAFRAAVLDPELTRTQPRMVTAVTGLDALAHALETFVCTRRNPLSQFFSKAAWRLLEPNLARVLQNPDDLAARGAMQLGAHLSGVAIENAMLGACHACANPLTARFDVTHGTAIALLLPHVLRLNGSVVGPLYSELLHETPVLSRALPPAEVLARRIEELRHLAGLPARLADAGVDAEALPLMAEEALQQWTGRFNPLPLDRSMTLRLYEAAY
jgi:alcohol dehydrogenase